MKIAEGKGENLVLLRSLFFLIFSRADGRARQKGQSINLDLHLARTEGKRREHHQSSALPPSHYASSASILLCSAYLPVCRSVSGCSFPFFY